MNRSAGCQPCGSGVLPIERRQRQAGSLRYVLVILSLLALPAGAADLDRARELLQAGRPVEAYEAVVVDLDAAQPDDATFEVAVEALFGAGRLVTAASVAQRWLEARTPNEAPQAYWYGGEAAVRLQQRDLAKARFRTFLDAAAANNARSKHALRYLFAESAETAELAKYTAAVQLQRSKTDWNWPTEGPQAETAKTAAEVAAVGQENFVLETLPAEIPKTETKSTDLAVRTRAILANSYPDNRQAKGEVDYRIRRVVETFLNEWQGEIPTQTARGKNKQADLAREICVRHLAHVWQDGEAKQDWGRLWGPRLGPDQLFVWAADAAADGGTNLAEQYAKLIKRGAPLSPSLLWKLTGMRDLGIGYDGFVPLRQEDLQDRELFAELLSKLPVWRRDGGGKRFSDAMWAYAQSEEAHKGEYSRIKSYAKCHWQYNVGGMPQQAANVVKVFVKQLERLPIYAQINAINVFIDNSREATDLFTLDALRRLYAALPDAERKQATAFEYVQQNVEFWLKDAATSAAQKEKARALREVMGENLARGMGMQAAVKMPHARRGPARDWLLRQIDAGNWELLGRTIGDFAATILPPADAEAGPIQQAYKDAAKPVLEALMKQGANELAYVLVQTLRQRGYGKVLGQGLEATLAQASLGLEAVPVDRNDPLYPLQQAAREQARGNVGRAWDLTAENQPLLLKRWRDLNLNYVAWTIDQMRKYRAFKPALTLAFDILATPELDPEIYARVSLTKGDVYRDDENPDAARIEYQALRDHPVYSKTQAGKLAQSRMINLLIDMRSYHNAEQLLAKLMDHRDADVRAEAHYLSARIAFEQEDFDTAKAGLEKALQLVPSHAQALLLEGRLRLYVERGLEETEIRLGEKRLRTIVVPGRTLRLTLPDKNLSVARHGKTVPVVVTSEPGGDRELLQMYPSSGDNKTFMVTLPTAMTKVKKGNSRLEIYGDDLIRYGLEPEFQKRFGLDYPIKEMEVRSEGRLVASAGRILSEDEEEELRMEQRLGNAPRRQLGPTTTVRPGNPIYLQVRDLDRNVTAKPDKVYARLETSSGDRLQTKLTEADAVSGIFRGEVKTGIPFPRAAVSDAVEGVDVNAVISTQRDGNWRSAPGEGPKWILADTMSSEELGKATVAIADADKIKQVTLEGSLAGEPVMLGRLPAVPVPDGLAVQVVAGSGGRALTQVRRTLGPPPSDFQQAEEAMEGRLSLRLPGPTLTPDKMQLEGLHRTLTVRAMGRFHLPKAGEMAFSFSGHGPGQDLYLLVDGTLVVSQHNRAETEVTAVGKVELAAGVHRLEVLGVVPSDGWEPIGVALNGEALPAKWFSRDVPELAAELQPPVTIERTETGFAASFREPRRLRKLKWVFEEFGKRQLTVSELTVIDAAGKQLLPTDKDYTAGLRNDTLEVAPGDRVTISYHDEKRLNANAPYLYSRLNAAYSNGSIDLSVELVQGDTLTYFQALRCRKGDTLMVTVSDADEDQSPQRDKLTITARTSGGEELQLTAVESGGEEAAAEGEGIHTGVYKALLRLGDKTGGETLKLEPGQTVTVSYLDRENLDPGVAFLRTSQVSEAGAGVPELALTPQVATWQKDESAATLERIERLERKSYNKGRTDLEIWTRTIGPAGLGADGQEPAALRSSVNGELAITVTHPAAALHSGSLFEGVTVVTESELAAAKAEGREPELRSVICGLRNLTDGLFGASVPLQVGSEAVAIADPGAMSADAMMGAMMPQAVGREPLIVTGTDRIRVQVKLDNGQTVEKWVQLASDGMLELMEQSFTARSSMIHLGETFFVRVTDRDRDATPERDEVTVVATAKSGDTVTLALQETFDRSGIFEGKLTPVAGADAPELLTVTPGDEVTLLYVDEHRVSSEKPVEIVATGRIREGADGELASFTKQFQDPEMAVKTSFLMAEALFEMAKDQRKLGDKEKAQQFVADGKKVLEEAIRDFPDTKLKAQGEYLLANLAEELGNLDEAIRRYAGVLGAWPDSEYAASSLFKKALCLEKKGEAEQALEEYVRLTYVYKESPLAADAVVRLASYYYKQQNYAASARIFGKFQENNPHHRLAAKSLALAGLSHVKAENFGEAMRCFDMVVAQYPDDKDVRAEAMYWLGDSAVSAKNYPDAYRAFKQLTWDYPDSKWAKMARGRLTENVLLSAGEKQ